MPAERRIRSNPERRPRGKRARMDRAQQLFGRGFSNAEVAREIGVTPETAKRYRDAWVASVENEAAANPTMLRDVLKNTLQALKGIDDVRAEAWDMASSRDIPSNVKVTYLGLVLKAERERANLLGLLGVKNETAALFGRVSEQQNQLINFMQNHLCETDRVLLENFITTTFAQDLESVQNVSDLMNT